MLNLEESAGYRRIFKKGVEKGVKKGVEKGVEKGKADLIIKLLQKKFGTALSGDYIKKIKKQNDATLDTIADNIFEISDIGQLNDYLV